MEFTFNKANAKTALSKLKRNKVYYIRARLIDAKGVCSNWSKTVKVKKTMGQNGYYKFEVKGVSYV